MEMKSFRWQLVLLYVPVPDADLVNPNPLLLPVELVEPVEMAEPVGRFVLSTFVETGLAKSISSSSLSPRPGPVM